jgi:energy-coupling factor transport system substrate-specific component
MKGRWFSLAVFGLTSSLGIAAFLYPFWMPALQQGAGGSMAHAGDAPLILTLLVGLCFAVLLLEVQSEGMSAKTVALLGVLVAINSILRFVDAAAPGPGGFSPIFVLVLLGGYVLGPRLGFLLGALTLFVSALITGGVGPWLPYQMFTAGWMGMSAPLLRPLVRGLGWAETWGETALLALFGALWGFVFGAVMNIWFWPFVAGSADQYWAPGLGPWATLQRYALFYVTTSLVWDITRAVGTAALILAFGRPILRVLERFRRRFFFVHVPLASLPQTSPQPTPLREAPVGAVRADAAGSLTLEGNS